MTTLGDEAGVDRHLICCDCQQQFTFSAAEKEFFRQKELLNEPKRCPNCRLVLRNWRRAAAGDGPEEITETNCAKCGAGTKVPFVIKGHSPVYCTLCLHARKDKNSDAQAVAETSET